MLKNYNFESVNWKTSWRDDDHEMLAIKINCFSYSQK